ncbi:B3 domain-containing protein Os01g0234100 [Linum perenne]
MGLAVKKEMEDGDSSRASSMSHTDFKSAGEDDAATLARSPDTTDAKPNNDLSSSLSAQMNSTIEKRNRRLKIKLSCSHSKVDRAISSHTGKCIRSVGEERSCEQHEARKDGLSTPKEVKSPALIRAEEIQSNLEPAFPSFLKALVRSHVGSCFWMGLPGPFCRANLPKEDTTVTLENEDGKEFNIKYIGYKTGLSAGWRQFCVAHKLLEGDVLVFQLVANCRFKVYIIRAHDLAEVDGALGLLNLDAHTKPNDAVNAVMAIIPSKSGKKKRSRPQSSFFRKKKRKTSMPRSSFQISGQAAEQSENDSEEVGSEVLEGFKLSFPGIQFKDVQNFEDFSIVVEGLVLDSELTEEVQRRYYKLCCSQNAFLHEELIKGLNFKLIAGLISETISIADAIRECSLSTSRDEFAIWDKTLRASELFGMNVGFLRERLRHLVSLAFDSEDAMKTRRYMEARSERLHTGDEISNLEAKLVELKEAYRRSGSDINALKSIAERYEIKFQKHVLAAW